MINNLFLTKGRLIRWGHWCNRIITMGLGYSTQSLLARLQEGGTIIDGGAKLLIPENEEAEEVDNLLQILADENITGAGKPEWAKVIRIHYTLYDKSSYIRVKTSGFPKRTYFRYLKSAECWLSEKLYE